ncbi:proton-conducting transporter membrane subunit [Streptomyces virginiae]|uniref:proton-conducting transporter transmembrane domain-containing protein n=1 Tax=Streptomyces virginiae TaxID=1961 RepID=UPI003AF33608
MLARTLRALSGPGGIPADAFRSTFVALGVITALLGALMCWQQRHLKRMLAFSTVGGRRPTHPALDEGIPRVSSR